MKYGQGLPYLFDLVLPNRLPLVGNKIKANICGRTLFMWVRFALVNTFTRTIWLQFIAMLFRIPKGGSRSLKTNKCLYGIYSVMTRYVCRLM